jgi:hypothetical protein
MILQEAALEVDKAKQALIENQERIEAIAAENAPLVRRKEELEAERAKKRDEHAITAVRVEMIKKDSEGVVTD